MLDVLQCWLCVFYLCSLGAFLLFSQKKLANLKQTESDAHVRDAAIMQVFVHNRDKILKQSFSFGLTLSYAPPQVVQQWHSLDETGRSKYRKKSSRCPEPSLGLFRPDTCFGSVSENFHSITEKYLQSRSETSQDSLDTNRYRFFMLKYK